MPEELLPPPDADTASVDEMVDYFVRVQKMSLEDARQAAKSALAAAGDYQAVIEAAPLSAEAMLSSADKAQPYSSGPVKTGEVMGGYGAQVTPDKKG